MSLPTGWCINPLEAGSARHAAPWVCPENMILSGVRREQICFDWAPPERFPWATTETPSLVPEVKAISFSPKKYCLAGAWMLHALSVQFRLNARTIWSEHSWWLAWVQVPPEEFVENKLSSSKHPRGQFVWSVDKHRFRLSTYHVTHPEPGVTEDTEVSESCHFFFLKQASI